MPENTEIRSEEVQDILEAVPSWIIRWGNIIVLLLVLIVLFISLCINYPDVIVSNSIITTEEPPQKEYAKSSGKITSLLVSDNENVTENSPLAILENTANHKDIYYLKAIVDTISPNNINFEFPFDELPPLFLGDIESDYALFENSYLQYNLNKQYQPFSDQAKTNEYTNTQLQSRLRTLRSQKALNKKELKFQKKDLERNKSLLEKGVIAEQEYESQELAYLQAERNFANLETSISQILETINNASRSSRETTLNSTREDISLLKNVLQSFNQLKRAIKDWELRYALKSNINGKVSFLKDWKVNQTVSQNNLMFTIIPAENSAYIAELKSPAQNSGKLKIGQTVNIKLEIYPDAEFGSLKGKISNIALFPDEEGLYLVKVALPEKLITSYKREIPFKHEMNGTAEIITEDLRLIERLFIQVRNILN